MRSILILYGFGLMLLGSGVEIRADKTPAAAPLSFNADVQPILSEYCFHCHGPDSASRKPKKHPLRLDRGEFANEPRDHGKAVILPGDPSGSELMRRIRSADADEVMPPTSERKPMKPEESAILERWIALGARYEKHWSLIPPSRPQVPKGFSGWAQSPIDVFIAAKLKANGLKPNPEEEKARLFRRLCFDLTGLPPSPDELRSFVRDRSLGAYERAVDRLLASDACAEQFSRRWLDAVRYADTQGIHHDHSRSIWPYRDWVIRSFKINEPFDRFTIEQLAGDLLPEADLDQQIASGYNRLLPTTGEGGAIPEEYEAIYAKDRVDTTAAVWLGLTTGCATCHDHKFDPFSQRDFYSLTAFFRNNTLQVLDDHTSADTPPTLFVPADSDRTRWKQIEVEVTRKKAQLDARREQVRPEFLRWLSAAPSSVATAESIRPDYLITVESGTNSSPHPASDSRKLVWRGAKQFHPGPFGPAPQLETGEPVEGEIPALERKGALSYGGWVFLDGKPSGAVISRMDKAKGYRGWDLLLTEGKPTVHIIDRYPEAALKVTAKEALKAERWHHVLAVFDGSRAGAEAIAIYVDGQRAAVDVNNNTLGGDLAVDAPLRLGGRSDGNQVIDTPNEGRVYAQDWALYFRALDSAEAAQLAARGLLAEFANQGPENRSPESTNRLFSLYFAGVDTESQALRTDLTKLGQEQDRLRTRGGMTLIMGEAKDREPVAYILNRGAYTSKGERVTPATPGALPGMKSEWPRNRLGLAKWLVDRQNPLTARVTMNRLWADLFGTGIVDTTEDFGVTGGRPSHPELLDWLAMEFMDSGWNYRLMVKAMVMSATYRQSAQVPAAKLEKDPLNRLLSRGPHLRLDAEQLRDQALAASGLLVRTIGGKPVRPYQPEGIWETVAMKVSNTSRYKQDSGDALYRRSLYTFWKRTAPPPSMEILNSPTRDVFCTRRDRTDTPLQALVTMNDPQFIEAARQLAAHACELSSRFDERADWITLSLMGRTMASAEKKVLRGMHDRAIATFTKDPTAAKALLAVGESRRSPTVPLLEYAAWTLVASEVMNLDESLTK